MEEWQVFQTLTIIVGFLISLYALGKPARDREEKRENEEKRRYEEGKIYDEKQQVVLQKLQISIAELNIILRKANELDKIRDEKIKEVVHTVKEHEKQINLNVKEIALMQNTSYHKNRNNCQKD